MLLREFSPGLSAPVVAYRAIAASAVDAAKASGLPARMLRHHSALAFISDEVGSKSLHQLHGWQRWASQHHHHHHFDACNCES